MTKSQDVHLKLPAADYEELKQIAEESGHNVADAIRLALREYTARVGRPLDFKVKHGGNRR